MERNWKEVRSEVKRFVEEEVYPAESILHKGDDDSKSKLSELMQKAKDNSLWALGHPKDIGGEGMPFMEYVYINEVVGRSSSAMVALGTHSLQDSIMLREFAPKKWRDEYLEPLVQGEIFPSFAMTEPDIPSSDAKNISCSAVLDGDEWVITGEKFYISGAGDPRCKIMICMVQTNPDGPPHKRQSQILVPMDNPGVEIIGPMHVFGKDDAPHGHMHLRFNDCRVPKDNILLGEGRGFEISQVRLGPGRIHHCMRSLGAAERAIEMMVKRGLTREAFGKPIASLGKNIEVIAKARIEIESMRRMVLTAAKAMDELGNEAARVWVSAVKAMVPIRVCHIIDEAIQFHGATGVSQWTPLADMYTSQRTLRLADGPDEVHWFVVGRAELRRWEEEGGIKYDPKVDYYSEDSKSILTAGI